METPSLPRVVQPNFTADELHFIGACFSHTVYSITGEIAGSIMAVQLASAVAHRLGSEKLDALGRKLRDLIV